MVDALPAGKKHYTIVSGTGRAGTTLLVRVLGAVGVRTGFENGSGHIDPVAHAGLERDLRDKPDCDVVKSPHIAAYIEDVFRDGDIAIDRAIICMRPLYDAAESRRRVQAARATDKVIDGGLTYTSNPARQEDVLAQLFFNLIFHLSQHDVPMTFLHYPRFVTDVSYFIAKIAPLFNVGAEALEKALHSEIRHDLLAGNPDKQRVAALSDNDLIREIALCDIGEGDESLGHLLVAETMKRSAARSHRFR